jgi:biopolymer transport protein ExbD
MVDRRALRRYYAMPSARLRFGMLFTAIIAAGCDSSPPQPPRIVVVEVLAADGGCRVQDRTVRCESIGEALRELPVDDHSIIRIYGSKETRYEPVGTAINAIQRAGYVRVEFGQDAAHDLSHRP